MAVGSYRIRRTDLQFFGKSAQQLRKLLPLAQAVCASGNGTFRTDFPCWVGQGEVPCKSLAEQLAVSHIAEKRK